MESQYIEKLHKEKKIILKSYEPGQIRSLLEKVERNIKVTSAISLTEESADVIFTQMYESVRQLGDVLWWLLGYEPQYHETSLEALKKAEFLTPEQKVTLQSLNRFKDIRHDSHYRGFEVSYRQAQEIKDFWNNVGVAVLKHINLTSPHSSR